MLFIAFRRSKIFAKLYYSYFDIKDVIFLTKLPPVFSKINLILEKILICPRSWHEPRAGTHEPLSIPEFTVGIGDWNRINPK